MARYILSEQARQDITEIWDYLADYASIDVADRVKQEFHRAFRRLAENPGLGHLREDLSSRPFRFYRVYSYLIIYQPDSNPLGVGRILHGSRDIRSLLERE